MAWRAIMARIILVIRTLGQSLTTALIEGTQLGSEAFDHTKKQGARREKRWIIEDG
jgi:hypothetical protein